MNNRSAEGIRVAYMLALDFPLTVILESKWEDIMIGMDILTNYTEDGVINRRINELNSIIRLDYIMRNA